MRSPAEYRLVVCACERSPGPILLTYSKAQGFFEPITNLDAAGVVGKVLSWTYV